MGGLPPGGWVDLRTGDPGDPGDDDVATAPGWNDDRTIRAEVIAAAVARVLSRR